MLNVTAWSVRLAPHGRTLFPKRPQAPSSTRLRSRPPTSRHVLDGSGGGSRGSPGSEPRPAAILTRLFTRPSRTIRAWSTYSPMAFPREGRRRPAGGAVLSQPSRRRTPLQLMTSPQPRIDRARPVRQGRRMGRAPVLELVDVAALEDFSRRDPSAVRAVYRAYGGLVYAVAHRVLGRRDLAEEATQQTFVRAWQAADRLDPQRDPGPWLATIAKRAALDIHRREARRTTKALDDVAADHPAIITLP